MNCAQSQDENIKEIEDIINIQKASGIFHKRQLGHVLPEETVSAVSFNQSLGLTNDREVTTKKKSRRLFGTKYLKGPVDLISWPSDSDITVLRMNLLQKTGGRGQSVCKSNIPGDGLHLPNSSSMVNLATLIAESQPSSKHSLSLHAEEYLMPLSSWEPNRALDAAAVGTKNSTLEIYRQTQEYISLPKEDNEFDEVVLSCNNNVDCIDQMREVEPCRIRLSQHESNSSLVSLKQTGSRVARFMRLYFCPCCTCLYQIENRCEQNARNAALAAADAGREQRGGDYTD